MVRSITLRLYPKLRKIICVGFINVDIKIKTELRKLIPSLLCSYSYQQTALQLQLRLFHSWCRRNCILWIIYTGKILPTIYSFGISILWFKNDWPITLFALHEQIDVWGLRPPFLFLEWIGMNAMLVYVMAAQGIFEGFINGWYYKSPDNTLVSNSISVYGLIQHSNNH